MIIDWFHRKFIERFLECENGDFRCPKIGKPLNEAEQNKVSWSKGKGHRFRYFIPEVNPSKNLIDPGITSGRQENFNTKEEEIKTETKASPRTCHCEFSKPELLNGIKKFYIITSDKKTEEEVLKLSAAFIKGIYSANIRKFLVLPLSDSGISHSDSDLNAFPHNESKQDGEEENLPNVYKEKEGPFEEDDSDEYFEDIFEEEYRYKIPDGKTEHFRDSLIRKPLGQYDEGTWQAFRKHQASILQTIDPLSNEIDTNIDEAEQKTDTRNLWRQSEIDGSWWCDLVDTEVPVTCQSLRSKLKATPKARETKSTFKSIFDKIFMTKTPENYSESEFCRVTD